MVSHDRRIYFIFPKRRTNSKQVDTILRSRNHQTQDILRVVNPLLFPISLFYYFGRMKCHHIYEDDATNPLIILMTFISANMKWTTLRGSKRLNVGPKFKDMVQELPACVPRSCLDPSLGAEAEPLHSEYNRTYN